MADLSANRGADGAATGDEEDVALYRQMVRAGGDAAAPDGGVAQAAVTSAWLKEALTWVTPLQRAVFLARFEEERSFDEIADERNTTATACRQAYRQARIVLMKAWKRDSGD
jgi:DNA-directed RNA polymerase specialized sigma24 family protein